MAEGYEFLDINSYCQNARMTTSSIYAVILLIPFHLLCFNVLSASSQTMSLSDMSLLLL